MVGSVEVSLTVTLEVWVGTTQVGSGPASGSATGFETNGASSMVLVASRRGSMKKYSGPTPLLVTETGTVTGVPAARRAQGPLGSPEAETCTALNSMLPVNGWESSSPTIGSANSTIRFKFPVPGSACTPSASCRT